MTLGEQHLRSAGAGSIKREWSAGRLGCGWEAVSATSGRLASNPDRRPAPVLNPAGSLCPSSGFRIPGDDRLWMFSRPSRGWPRVSSIRYRADGVGSYRVSPPFPAGFARNDYALRVDGEFVAAGRPGTAGSGACPTLVFSCTGRIACGAPADAQIRALGRAPRQGTDQIRRSAGECGRIPCGATGRHGPHAKMILSWPCRAVGAGPAG